MYTADKLVQTLLSINNNIDNNILIGIVSEESPIKITVEDLPPLTEKQLILTEFVKEKKVKIKPHKHKVNLPPTTGQTGEVTLEVVLWENLKKGDKVIIISSSDKQKYLVIGRV